MSSAEQGDLIEAILARIPDWIAATAHLNELVANRLGIAATDLRCLHQLNRVGPTTPGGLAESLGRTTGAATRIIDRLERAGFVRRVPAANDRRCVIVEATADGLASVGRYFDSITARSRESMGGYSREELETLLHFVQSSQRDTVREIEALLKGCDLRLGPAGDDSDPTGTPC
jgi:DNA-binding MarR family transcriptional regulator